MCCEVGLEAIQSVLRQVDVDAGGRLDKMQFRKAIRMLQDSRMMNSGENGSDSAQGPT